mgnify:CR=1 FL=1
MATGTIKRTYVSDFQQQFWLNGQSSITVNLMYRSVYMVGLASNAGISLYYVVSANNTATILDIRTSVALEVSVSGRDLTITNKTEYDISVSITRLLTT